MFAVACISSALKHRSAFAGTVAFAYGEAQLNLDPRTSGT